MSYLVQEEFQSLMKLSVILSDILKVFHQQFINW